VRAGSRPCRYTITHGKIVQIDMLADPARLRRLNLAILGE
jgi:hypothetical protein